MTLIFDLKRRPENLLEYAGVAFIGDPHLESRQPGFRKDNYAETILEKLAWILQTCRDQHFLPVFLGDFFERPRDNPNRLVGRLIDLLSSQESITIFGNHDCSEPVLTDDDSLSLLFKGSRLRLVSGERLAVFRMNERTIVIGGSSYREPLPNTFSKPEWAKDSFVCWIAHHDIFDSANPNSRVGVCPVEIPGVDAVINGHLHRQQPERAIGETRWFIPGNISRRSRHEATAAHRPHFLSMTLYMGSMLFESVEIPHRPVEEVFHERAESSEETASLESTFIQGLADLESVRTDSGAGLVEFLKLNRHQFSPEVNDYIEGLRQEVMENVN